MGATALRPNMTVVASGVDVVLPVRINPYKVSFRVDDIFTIKFTSINVIQ